VEGAVACGSCIQRTRIDDARVWTTRSAAHDRDGVKSSRDVEVAGGRSVLLCRVGQREVVGRGGLKVDRYGVGVYVGVRSKNCAAQTAIVWGNGARAGAGVVVVSIDVECRHEWRRSCAGGEI